MNRNENRQLRNERKAGKQEIARDFLRKVERKKKEKRQKINESRYNSNYKNIIIDKPKYLQERRKRKDRGLIAKYVEIKQKGVKERGRKQKM